jgi:hypothetical protein
VLSAGEFRRKLTRGPGEFEIYACPREAPYPRPLPWSRTRSRAGRCHPLTGSADRTPTHESYLEAIRDLL